MQNTANSTKTRRIPQNPPDSAKNIPALTEMLNCACNAYFYLFYSN